MTTWRWLGEVAHAEAWRQQEAAREAVCAGAPGQLLLCTHPTVITLGRSADRSHVRADAATLAAHHVDVVATDRGGDVTLHDPGQLLVYPIVRVRAGVVALLETVAAELVALAASVGVDGAAWRRAPAGVWLGDAKLAACGVHLRRGVAAHGFAFNVATPPERWAWIVPCGLDTPVTSLAQACAVRGRPAPPAVATLAARLGPALAPKLG